MEIARVSRAGYYKRKQNEPLRAKKAEMNALFQEHLLAIHRAHPYYGYPRIVTALKEEGIHANHKRVFKQMKILGIASVIRKKRRYFGRKGSVVFPNILQRDFSADLPNQKYVTDITFVRVGTVFFYVSVILDLYNNEIVAWKISTRNDLRLVIETIEEWTQKRDVRGTTLHSDQGFQYTSPAYNKRLEGLGVQGSHSRKGNCLDNACIESFFSHLKTEKLYLYQCKTEQELHQALQEYVYFYNYERFQKKLNQCAPIEYRVTLAA